MTRVTNIGTNTIIQLERQCLAIESRVCVPPIRFTMKEFERHKRERQNGTAEWLSPSFYTHPQGYRMCLGVFADGIRSDTGTHVTAQVYIMQGEFNDHLKWPFRGVITIQILNQLEDKEHYEQIIEFSGDESDNVAGRKTEALPSVGRAQLKFISHAELHHNCAKNCQYLHNDCLCFRVTKVELKNKTHYLDITAQSSQL